MENTTINWVGFYILPSSTIDLRNAEIEYPTNAADWEAYFDATLSCRTGTAECLGVPPDSCAAFGTHYQVSLADSARCDLCPESLLGPALIFAGLALGTLAVVTAYVVVIVRFPSALKRWASTLTILSNHMQSIALIGGLDLAWPASSQLVMSALSLDMLQVPEAACLVGADAISPFWLYAIGYCLVVLAFLVFLPLWRLVAEHRGQVHLADHLEFVLTIIYSVQLPMSWRLVASVLLTPGGYGGGTVIPMVALALSAALVVMQVWLCVRFVRNMRAFRRGNRGDGWKIEKIAGLRCRLAKKRSKDRIPIKVVSRPSAPHHCLVRCFTHCCRGLARCFTRCLQKMNPVEVVSEPIAPRRLDKQVRYFTLRFGAHAPCWQQVIWLRQLALFATATTAKAISLFVRDASPAWPYAIAATAIVILLAAWWLHRRTQPYTFRFQNGIESWLFASNVVLLALACVYSAITHAAKTARLVCEVMLFAPLVSGMLVAGVVICRDAHAARRAFRDIDLTAVLMSADARIDRDLRKALVEGDVRLLKCSWFVSAEADTVLGRHASGAVILKRMQDLPPEAFHSPEEAAALLDRGDRSVLALSYRWLTGLHPEPLGTTVAAVRRYLRSKPSTMGCGLFLECA